MTSSDPAPSDPAPSDRAPSASETQVLLRRWHGGDQAALGTLISKHVAWIEQHVRRQLGNQLRAKDQTQDIVQDAIVEFMKYGPRFELSDEVHFCGLVARIVRNVIADRHAWFTRRRRDMHRERPMPDQTTLVLDPRARSATRPDAAAARAEENEMLRLGLELLRPEDREVIVRKRFDDEDWSTIAGAVQSTPEGVRKRYARAVKKLTLIVRRLEGGQIGSLIADDGVGQG